MHKQSPSAKPKRRATYAPRSSTAVAFLLLTVLRRVLVLLLAVPATVLALLLLAVSALGVLVLILLVAILATLLATVALVLALARRRPAAFAGLLVDVDVALLAVIPTGDPWVGDLRLATAGVLLGLAAVGRLLLLLLVVFVTAAEGVEELFYEAGHYCLLLVNERQVL